MNLIHAGAAISTEEAVHLLGSGAHGALDGPEGVVYRYESKESGFLFLAKYVCNPLSGDQELFQRNINSGLMNSYSIG